MREEQFTFKSIFSLLEEQSKSPTVFIWLKNKTLLNIDPRTIKFKSELFTIKREPKRLCKHHYALTLNTLIQYKVSFISD